MLYLGLKPHHFFNLERFRQFEGDVPLTTATILRPVKFLITFSN